MIMMRTRWRALAIALLAIAGAVACGRNTPAAGATEKTTPPGGVVSTPPRSTAKNACRLVDLAQIEAIAKQKLGMMHVIEGDDHTVCELSDLKTNQTLVSVTLYWAGGKEMARVNQAAMSMARQMLNDDDTDIEEITGSAKVRGLADKAYYSNLMPSWMLKGDVMIEIISPLFSNDQTKAVFLSVSKTALARL